MNSVLPFLALLLHALAALAVGAGIVWLVSDVRRASRTLALIMTAGLLLRFALGLSLFLIADHNLPILQSLRTPDGIWTFALDSSAYLHDSTAMAEHGHVALPAGLSPDYVVWLTGWMRIVGTTAAAAPFLNLTLFALLCWLIVRMAAPCGLDRDDLPQLVTVGSFAFSPVLLLHGSQALKDDLCAALLAVACVGALQLFSHQHEARGVSRRHTAGLLTVLAAVYALAGLRNYAAGLVGSAAVAVSALPWVYRAFTRRAWAAWGGITLVVVSLAAGLWMGAAGDAAAARAESARQWVTTAGRQTLLVPDRFRSNFHKTGGNTNLVEGPVPPIDAPAAVLTWPERGRALITGLGAIFIPMTVLHATGTVHIGMGPAMRIATDVDTLFLDASILATMILLAKRRAAVRWHLRYICFALTLCFATTGFMAYVVTNFGTLFRLRVMVAVPIWMLGLAMSRGPLPAVRRVSYAQFKTLIERT